MLKTALSLILLAASLVATSAQAASDHHAGHGAMAATGAGEPGRPADARRTVRIAIGADRYDTGTIPVRAGETVRFVVTNRATVPHEFAIATRGETDAHRAMMQQMPGMVHDQPNVLTVAPGETRELVWRFAGEADMVFACNRPGYETMTGRFAVSR